MNKILSGFASVVLVPQLVFAQSLSSPTELLRPTSAESKAEVARRHPISLEEHRYFAKPGRFGIFTFDIDVLQREGEIITITPFHGEQIQVLSRGLDIHEGTGGRTGRWTGELLVPNSDRTVLLQWPISIRAIDSDGNIRYPDPNREVTQQILAEYGEQSVVLQESYDRLNEKIMYGLLQANIPLPHLREQLIIAPIDPHFQTVEEFDTIVIYEQDKEKILWFPDDSPRREGIPEERNLPGIDKLPERAVDAQSLALEQELQRRTDAYEQHMIDVRRRVAEERTEE